MILQIDRTFTLGAIRIENTKFLGEEPIASKTWKILHKYYSESPHLGWWDLLQLQDYIHKHHITDIVLEDLDILGKIGIEAKGIQMCTFYLYHNSLLKKLPEKPILSKCCTPGFSTITLGGWEFSTEDAELPYKAECYMQNLLKHTKVRTISYSTKKFRVTASWGPNDLPICCYEYF